MHALTAWFIRNPVAANLLMALILFLGVQTALSIRIEGFPRIPPESVNITIEYPGATAAQGGPAQPPTGAQSSQGGPEQAPTGPTAPGSPGTTSDG